MAYNYGIVNEKSDMIYALRQQNVPWDEIARRVDLAPKTAKAYLSRGERRAASNARRESLKPFADAILWSLV